MEVTETAPVSPPGPERGVGMEPQGRGKVMETLPVCLLGPERGGRGWSHQGRGAVAEAGGVCVGYKGMG